MRPRNHRLYRIRLRRQADGSVLFMALRKTERGYRSLGTFRTLDEAQAARDAAGDGYMAPPRSGDAHWTRRRPELLMYASLSDDDVRAVRRRYRAGETRGEIAKDYPRVCADTIGRIARGVARSHVKDEEAAE